MQEITTLSAKLASVDEFTAVLAGSGWGMDFRPLDTGPDVAELKAAATDSTVVFCAELSTRVHQLVVPPAGMISFGLPSKPQAPGRLGRRALDSETLTCFSPSSGLDVVSAAGFSVYTFAFEARRVSQLAELSGVPDPTLIPETNGVQHDIGEAALLRLRSFMAYFFEALDCGDLVVLSNAWLALESDLLLEMVSAYSVYEESPYISPSSRSRVLKRALEYIYSRPQSPLSVEELCRESACSLSTLERAFRAHLGVSPKQYLTISRLSGVRRTLLDPEEFRTIGDIASAWGFWHMSKFAADYKRAFGELPSATRGRGGRLVL